MALPPVIYTRVFPRLAQDACMSGYRMPDGSDFNGEVQRRLHWKPFWKPCAGTPPPCACSATMAESEI